MHIILFILLGAITGTVSGLLGIGGNIILIPLSTIILKKILHFSDSSAIKIAIASSMLTMVTTSLSSAFFHYRRENIVWSFYQRAAPFIVIGTICGVVSVNMLNGYIIEKIFGIFLIIIGFYLCFNQKFNYIKSIPAYIIIIISFLIGFKSGLLGLGGGLILIPLLTILNYQGTKIAGTTAICNFTIAIVSSTSFIIQGASYIYWPMILAIIPSAIIFARLGVILNARINQHLLYIIFRSIVILLGIYIVT